MLTVALKPLLAALYVLWSLSWLAVAWNYGKAAHVSWRVAGGTWRAAPGQLAEPFAWGLRYVVCRLPVLRSAKFCALPAEVPSRYERGHLLRFAIFLGSVKPVLWGWLVLKYLTSNLSTDEYLLSIAGLGISVLAAFSHLLLAYKTSPRTWASLVAAGLTWLALAPVILVVTGIF